LADKRKLARRLALWSIADQIDHESVDKEVALYSKNSSEDAEELVKISEQIEKLQSKQKEIVKRMIFDCSLNVQRLQEQTENSIAKPLVDLAFWNRMSDLNPDLYKIIHPYLSEIGDEKS
jgi:hypothetical protein